MHETQHSGYGAAIVRASGRASGDKLRASGGKLIASVGKLRASGASSVVTSIVYPVWSILDFES